MTINFSNNNPYKNFMQISGKNSSVPIPVSPTSPAENNNPAPQISSVNVGDVQENDTTQNNKSNKKIFGIIGVSVGSVALLSLIGLFTLSKGFSSGFSKKFRDISKSLQKKIAELSASTKELTTSEKLKLKASKILQPMADTMQASSNISAVKDSWFRHQLKKFGLEPMVQKINKAFKGVVTKNTKNYYTKAETANLQLCSYLDDLAKQTNDPKASAELKQYANKMREAFKNNFSTAEHFNRTEKAFKGMQGIDEKVYNTLFNNGGLFKNVKKYKTYITTDIVAKDRKALAEMLNANKAKLAVDPKAEKGLAQDALNIIKEKFGAESPQLKQAQQHISKLNGNLNNAIASELNAYEKLAELQVGSVPTDILGILGPTALATGMVISADNKDERISKFLTQGIPILGGVGISYYGTTRGWTGAKNLILGLATGYGLNLIGNTTNDFYKKYVEKQNIMKSAFEAWSKLQTKNSAVKEAQQKK